MKTETGGYRVEPHPQTKERMAEGDETGDQETRRRKSRIEMGPS